jgi:hypothetical protein
MKNRRMFKRPVILENRAFASVRTLFRERANYLNPPSVN